QTFSAVYSSTLGAYDLTNIALYFRSSTDGAPNTCSLSWAGGRVYLLTDSGTDSTSATPGTAVNLENSQCRVNIGGTSVSGNGNNLTFTVPVTFKQAFTGGKQVKLSASDGALSTGLNILGTWTVPSGSAATPVSVTPTG